MQGALLDRFAYDLQCFPLPLCFFFVLPLLLLVLLILLCRRRPLIVSLFVCTPLRRAMPPRRAARARLNGANKRCFYVCVFCLFY
jgi:hypothetical protein